MLMPRLIASVMHIPGVTETKKKVGRKSAIMEKSTAEATVHPFNKKELYPMFSF
jgi:hypothetical protein